MPTERTQPLVSVLILNWNGQRCLSRAIEAVLGQTCQDFELLVVDNASTDGSVDGLEARYPRLRLLRSPVNLGFAAGNNLGAAQAQGRWLALVNNDAFLQPGCLQAWLEAAARCPEYTFFAARLLRAADPGLVEAAGDIYHVSGTAWHRCLNTPLAQVPDQAVEVFSPSAAAALYDRQAFLDVGGFNERFSSHFEDVDLGFRLRLRGHRCLYVPGAAAEHLGSASYGVESDTTILHGQRNRLWVYWANMPGWLFWKHLPAHLLSNLVFLAYYLRRGRARVILRAQAQALAGLPQTWRERRRIQARRLVRPADLERLMERSLLAPYRLGRQAAIGKRSESTQPPLPFREGVGGREYSHQEFRYLVPPGVELVSTSGRRRLLSTSAGGRVIVDPPVLALWRLAAGKTLAEVLAQFGPGEPAQVYPPKVYSPRGTQQLAGLAADASQLRTALACLAAAGLLQRDPAPLPWQESQGTERTQAASAARISVILVSFNSLKWLPACLDSLRSQAYPPYEIILVDNGSGDATSAWAGVQPDVRLLRLERSVGLAQAINCGIAAASGAYFLILNPDIVLDSGALAELLAAAAAAPAGKTAAVAAKLRLLWAPAFLNGLGNFVPPLGWGFDLGLGHLDLGQYDGQVELPSACFAAALIPQAAWQAVGPLDEGLPMYYEDSEWCYRARLLGWRIRPAPRALVYHAFSGADPASPAGRLSPQKLQRITYGRLRFVMRLAGPQSRLRRLALYALEDLLRALGALLRGRWSALPAAWRAWRQFLAERPALRRQAQALQARRAISEAALFALPPGASPAFLSGGFPQLTWDLVCHAYAPLIMKGQAITPPEFQGLPLRPQPSAGWLRRIPAILRREGWQALLERLGREILLSFARLLP